MVRIKNRYLLIQILSPSASTITAPNASPGEQTSLLLGLPSAVQYHHPTPDNVDHSTLLRTFRAQLLLLFGDHGAGVAAAGLAIKYWSNATSTLILRCSRASVRMVWAAVTFVRSLTSGNARGGPGRGVASVQKDIVMQVVRVSGTIRKCEEEAVRRARAICGRVKGLMVVEEAGMDVKGGLEVQDDDESELAAGFGDVDLTMVDDLDGLDEGDSDEDV